MLKINFKLFGLHYKLLYFWDKFIGNESCFGFNDIICRISREGADKNFRKTYRYEK